MNITQRELQALFSAADIQRGRAYFDEGRVRNFRETELENGILVHCQVEGTKAYDISIISRANRKLFLSCTCPQFERAGGCKHLVAALLRASCEEIHAREAKTDHSARLLLDHFLERQQPISDPTQLARLVPRLHGPSFQDYPHLTFQVGFQKLYVIKHIRDFLKRVESGEIYAYGKGLELCHARAQFDAVSRELISLLMNEYPEFSTMYAITWPYIAAPSSPPESITLRGDAFDRFFDLFCGTAILHADTKTELHLAVRDPELTITLDETPGGAVLSTDWEENWQFFGSIDHLYAIGRNCLLRCSPAFRDAMQPLLKLQASKMVISQNDLPTFCSCVMPAMQGVIPIQDERGLLQTYLPEDCIPCFYFDLVDDTLGGMLKFRYGEQEIAVGTSTQKTTGIRRNALVEQQAERLIERLMEWDNVLHRYTLSEDDRIYNFLTGSLDAFHAIGEVYLSSALQSKHIRSARTTVGLSVADGVLNLDIDTGEFPPEELEALYNSLLQRRKYHKLADGRYLTLDGSSYETLAELAHMTQLTAAELKSGHASLPAYRALYLDAVLKDAGDVSVTRDRQFRSLIRSFRSVAESDFTPAPEMAALLRPYQKTGFRWLKTLESCGFGGILADEMGLGKTIQTIAFLQTVPQAAVGHPSLIICPASLILNWADELHRFAPELRVGLMLGSSSERRAVFDGSWDILVTSYDLLRRDSARYLEQQFYCVVLDEGQMIKNKSTIASQTVKQLRCRQRFILTGTPIENRLSELWNLFDFLMPGYLFTHGTFLEKLEKPIVQTHDAAAQAKLSKLVQPFILRRLKQDVLRELPPKISHVRRIALDESERKTYLATAAALKSKLVAEHQGKLQILAALTQLRQICCDPNLCFENYDGKSSKLQACVELCSSMVENGHQILLFSQFTSMLDRIRTRLDDLGISSYTLQGSTPKEKRQQLVAQFNAGGASVFLISLKAGGTGLNLTAADVVIHYDPWWNIAAQNQATDRAHRIGQQNHVHVYQLITEDTIEERILTLQEKKAALMDLISGGTDDSILSMSQEDLLALLD